MEETPVGRVFDYFAKIGVAAIKVSDSIKVGDTLHFKGSTTDFTQKLTSMQVENKSVEEANSGDSIGIKVKDRVRKNDDIFLAE